MEIRAICDSGTGPPGLAIIKLRQLCGLMPQRIGQQHHHIDRAGAAESLAHHGTRVGGFDGIEHVLSLETGSRPSPRAQLDRDRRRAALALELQIHDAGYFPQHSHDRVTGRIERIQVFAEDLDGHLCGLAAQALADAVPQER